MQAGISLKIHKLGLGKYLFPTIAEGQKTFVKYSREQARERIALGAGSRKDFFHYLLDAKDPQTGEGYTMSELWSESNLLIAAGELLTVRRFGETAINHPDLKLQAPTHLQRL